MAFADALQPRRGVVADVAVGFDGAFDVAGEVFQIGEVAGHLQKQRRDRAPRSEKGAHLRGRGGDGGDAQQRLGFQRRAGDAGVVQLFADVGQAVDGKIAGGDDDHHLARARHALLGIGSGLKRHQRGQPFHAKVGGGEARGDLPHAVKF